MKPKSFLLAGLLACLLPLAVQADVWQDPETKVNYGYSPGSGVAQVLRSGDVEGDIVILHRFTIDGTEYVVTTNERYAFYGNEALRSISIPGTVEYINFYTFQDCSSLSSVQLGERTYGIGDYCFYRTQSLKSIVLPSSLTNISYHAFSESALDSITIPDGITWFGRYNFKDCRKLKKVVLPAVSTFQTDWGGHGYCRNFENCIALEEVVCRSSIPPTILDNPFAGVDLSKVMLYVPQGSKEQYQSASIWNEFKDIVEKDIDTGPTLLNITPHNEETDIPTSGKIVLTFSEAVRLRDNTTGKLNDVELVPIVNDNTITFEYLGLETQKTYTLTLPHWCITDLVGNIVVEDINLTFTTSEHPSNAILPYGQFSHQPWIAKNYEGEGYPPSEWYKIDFDDSEWGIVVGPISSTPGTYYNTDFPADGSKHFWLRRYFNLNKVDNQQQYVLYVAHDDDCVIYLNGVEVFNEEKAATSTINIDPTLLRTGINVVAVDVQDIYYGVAMIDFGIYTDAEVKSSMGTIATDKQQYLSGENVSISGLLAELSNIEVEVRVVGDGVCQTLTTKSDAQGAFIAEWTPLSGQMGRFNIGVTYKGMDLVDEPAVIDVIGLKRTNNGYITCDATVGEPFVGEIELVNPCGVAQHIKEVDVLASPDNCEVTTEQPATIAAGEKAVLKYTLTGSAPSPGQDWEQVQLRLTTEEGATLDVTLYYYCRPAQAVLVASESSINTTMAKGTSRDYPVVITNQGKGETGKIRLSMPDVSWMTLVTPVEMNSLAYGEQATVLLRLTPGDDLPLNIPQTGTIGVNCENGDGIAIPYSIEAVSEQRGILTIDVVDEFSGDDATGPHVKGATVEVKHPTIGTVIANGITDENGKCSIGLPEGYYSISVTAEKHSTYANNVLVDPDRETTQEVFLSYEAITYSWTMEETEVEDQYEITTTATFETNVPKPVLIITLPDKKPGPNEVFPIVLTNHGLINTEHVDLSAYCTGGFEFEILNQETLEILGPTESHTYYAVIKGNEELWTSSCITAYVIADGYYQCRGLQHVQARADLYRCTQNQQGDMPTGGGGPWPGALPPVGVGGGYGSVTGGATGGDTPWISWCESCSAKVKLGIEQTLWMSRSAYRGTLTLYNGHESIAMTNVGMHFVITDEEGKEATEQEFVRMVESLNEFTGEETLPGDWTLDAGKTGTAKVLFVPTPLAAPDTPKRYTFKGTLTLTDPFSGQQLTLPLLPSTFTIQPLPELELTYLMQRDIYGDDPLTEGVVEPMVPAEFALIINNINNMGNGTAQNVRMLTKQPRIIDNEKGLLIDFAIESALVNGQSSNVNLLGDSFLTDFGNIPAHSQSYAQWWLTSTLLGHFISYDVETVQQTDYGSLISTTTIHEMVHGFTVATDEHGLTQRGWLVNDIADAGDQPDVVYFTDATQQPLHIATGRTDRHSDREYLLTVTAEQEGWNYGIVDDPTGGSLRVAGITRMSDGAEMPLDNVWQTDRTLPDGREWTYEHKLHFVALLPNGGDSYLLMFKTAEELGINDLTVDGGQDGSLRLRLNGKWLTVTGDFGELRGVEVYDLRGMKRMQTTRVQAGQPVYIGSLSHGVYDVRVSTDCGTMHVKMLKR